MNKLLKLKGKFKPKDFNGQFGQSNIPANKSIDSKHLRKLRDELSKFLLNWDKTYLGDYALLTVCYNKVVAKSNRIKQLLLEKATININNSIRGARFEMIDGKRCHVFTYYLKIETIEKAIEKLDDCIKKLDDTYRGSLSNEQIKTITHESKFIQILVDCYYIQSFMIDSNKKTTDEESIITIYKTNEDTKKLFRNIGIELNDSNVVDDTTIRLERTEYNKLVNVAPYLIATQVNDFCRIQPLNETKHEDTNETFPEPNNEPVVGVIDTHFDKNISFSNWVDYENMLQNVPIKEEDMMHGTEVASIIVNGPAFNNDLEDECGMFRVKLFGVATKDGFSWFSIYKNIESIIKDNPKIKVWNFSLGAIKEIDDNFISPIGALLDKLQNEHDIIFIVSGTNKDPNNKNKVKIGAPADSLNSIVVNSVDRKGAPASYTRIGPVLSFFHKPDVSCFGGVDDDGIAVGSPTGLRYVTGTSISAPWITRKIAYLIYKMDFTKEAAKALILDSAMDWNTDISKIDEVGFGVVPTKISEILSAKDDEIRFIINEKVDNYQIFNYELPVPIKNDKYCYFAKATLCYFPHCDRNQGVDYTTGEMSLKFGRMRIKNNEPYIQAIDNNIQDDSGEYTYEEDARRMFRKWDNVKHISTGISESSRPKDTFGQKKWGMAITTKDRINIGQNRGINVGIVITLKDMNGENRCDEFVEMCKLNNWMVEEIDVKNMIDVHEKLKEDIEFDSL